jgi:hypothetical protein
VESPAAPFALELLPFPGLSRFPALSLFFPAESALLESSVSVSVSSDFDDDSRDESTPLSDPLPLGESPGIGAVEGCGLSGAFGSTGAAAALELAGADGALGDVPLPEGGVESAGVEFDGVGLSGAAAPDEFEFVEPDEFDELDDPGEFPGCAAPESPCVFP